MKLDIKETKFTLKQRIEELTKWLYRYPDSQESSRRNVELEAAKEQLEFIEKK